MISSKAPLLATLILASGTGHSATLNPEQSDVGLLETEHQYSMTPFKTRFTEDCVFSNAEQLGASAVEERGSFKLGCKIEEVVEKLKLDPQPGLQVLALKLIKDRIVQNREEFRKQSIESMVAEPSKKKFSMFEGLFLKTLPVPALPSVEKLEADFNKKSQAYVNAADAIFLMEDNLLGFEKAYYYSQILGESLHFAEFIKFVNENPRNDLRHDWVAWGASWYEKYQQSKNILRPWLFEKAMSYRPKKVQDANSDRELFYWLLSVELHQPEEIKSQKKDILSSLRALWVNYPLSTDAQKIRKSADLIGLNREFSPPGINQMDFPETLLRAQALLKKMDYEGAQKSLRRIWSLDSKKYTPAQAFEAFQLHIKILRYADQRHKIPELIKKYLAWSPQIYKPKLGERDLGEHLSRGADLARTYWTYVDIDQALSLIEELIDYSKKGNYPSNVPVLQYLRARIMEQKGNKEAALGYFDEALKNPLGQDMKVDLFWRYFYLHFEKATPTATLNPLFSILDRIKKDLPGQDNARLFYWQGKVFTLALTHGKNKEAAIKQFLRAYEAEPFSFYANLAGLELINLGVTPPQWVNEKTEGKIFAPIWADYISSDGNSQAKEYLQLARLYHLSKIRERTLATRAYSDVDKSVWTYLLSSKNSDGSKSSYGQAIAWLKFSLGDAMGGLRVAEVLRMGLKGRLGAVEQTLLYPLPYFDQIKVNAEKYGANPWLAASLIRQESAFNPRAKSFANAIGLMQMIPPVAAQEAKILNIEDFNPDMLYTPKTALQLGTSHLGGLIKTFDGSWICAVASYNAGQPPVKKWVQYYNSSHPVIFIERISYAETRNYVKSILRNYINYQRIYGKGTIQTASLFDLPGPETTLFDIESTKGPAADVNSTSSASPL